MPSRLRHVIACLILIALPWGDLRSPHSDALDESPAACAGKSREYVVLWRNSSHGPRCGKLADSSFSRLLMPGSSETSWNLSDLAAGRIEESQAGLPHGYGGTHGPHYLRI